MCRPHAQAGCASACVPPPPLLRTLAAPLAEPLPALQASLCFVLPTILLWRQQLHAAREYAGQQQRQEQRAQRAQRTQRQPLDHRPDGMPAAEAELQACQYTRLCKPVLEAVDACPGGWLVTVALAALAGFVTATVARPGA